MTIYSRVNNHDAPRPPLEFGIAWDTSNSNPVTSKTRLGDAVGLTVDTTNPQAHVSGFSNYYPLAGMKRTNLNYAGDLLAEYGDSTYTTTSAAYEQIAVMNRVPYFFYKFEVVGNVFNYWLSPYPLKGYRLHPAFFRYDYTTTAMKMTDFYVGSFEAGVNAYDYSVANASPDVATSRTAWRTSFGTDYSYGYQLMDWYMVNALYWLWFIEYGGTNSQSPSGSSAMGGLGEGITHAAAVQTTGYTSAGGPTGYVELGNTSGNVQIPTTNDYAMSYRGIENLWGNTWTMIDGININLTDRVVWLAGNRTFGDTCVSPYQITPFTAPAADAWLEYPTPETGREGDWMWGNWVTGGSATTYVCDYYDGPATWTVIHYPMIGGRYDSSTNGGLWAVDCNSVVATTGPGARVALIPLDVDYSRGTLIPNDRDLVF